MSCQNCGSPDLKTIPAGTSKKTGKPYNAFTVCNACETTQFKVQTPVEAPPSKVEGLLTDIRQILIEIRDSKSPTF